MMKQILSIAAVTALVVGAYALADVAIKDADSTDSKPPERWLVSCPRDQRPAAAGGGRRRVEQERDIKGKAATVERVKNPDGYHAGRWSPDGARCHLIGTQADDLLLTCQGDERARDALASRGCTITTYDTLATTDAKDTRARALRRGSTCIGEATVTHAGRTRTYTVWPCRWETDGKPGFRRVRLDAVGPGVIGGRGELQEMRRQSTSTAKKATSIEKKKPTR